MRTVLFNELDDLRNDILCDGFNVVVKFENIIIVLQLLNAVIKGCCYAFILT